MVPWSLSQQKTRPDRMKIDHDHPRSALPRLLCWSGCDQPEAHRAMGGTQGGEHDCGLPGERIGKSWGKKMGKSWEKMMSRLIQMMIFEWLKYVEMDVQWLFDMGWYMMSMHPISDVLYPYSLIYVNQMYHIYIIVADRADRSDASGMSVGWFCGFRWGNGRTNDGGHFL